MLFCIPSRGRRRNFGHGFRFTEHADFTVNSLGLISHRHTQTQRTRILDTPVKWSPLANFTGQGIYRMSRMERMDRVKASCGAVLGKKISELILSPTSVHIGLDALHRGPSPCEGPFSDSSTFLEVFFSVFSVSRASAASGW